MTVRTALVALALSLPVAASAQTVQVQPQLPPLSATAFADLQLYVLQPSNFSPGWDSIKSVAIGDNKLMRLFYRKSNGLLVGILEDNLGRVLTQTARAWSIGPNLEQFDATPMVLSSSGLLWSAEVVVSTYDRVSGRLQRWAFYWEVAIP